ncbi:MAG: hypothetical protein PV340_04865 [Wolbachia sp.]|nr:hypothetical protein [Wolbachia sp.]
MKREGINSKCCAEKGNVDERKPVSSLKRDLLQRGLLSCYLEIGDFSNALMPLNEKVLFRKRSIIEIVFDYLKNKFRI